MTNTIARIKKTGKNFEILVDMDAALAFKKGLSNFIEAESGRVFTDSKKGLVAPSADLTSAFGTTDIKIITSKIVKEGEILVTQEHRDEEKEKKFKQVVDFLVVNSIDPKSNRPHTPERIHSALNQAGVNIKNVPIEQQINDIIGKISSILPIKLETKRIKIKVPAIHTGKAYGIFAQYKEDEKWLDDGSLEITVKVPSGTVIDFYDKLNSVTHGSAYAEEIKE